MRVGRNRRRHHRSVGDRRSFPRRRRGPPRPEADQYPGRRHRTTGGPRLRNLLGRRTPTRRGGWWVSGHAGLPGPRAGARRGVRRPGRHLRPRCHPLRGAERTVAPRGTDHCPVAASEALVARAPVDRLRAPRAARGIRDRRGNVGVRSGTTTDVGRRCSARAARWARHPEHRCGHDARASGSADRRGEPPTALPRAGPHLPPARGRCARAVRPCRRRRRRDTSRGCGLGACRTLFRRRRSTADRPCGAVEAPIGPGRRAEVGRSGGRTCLSRGRADRAPPGRHGRAGRRRGAHVVRAVAAGGRARPGGRTVVGGLGDRASCGARRRRAPPARRLRARRLVTRGPTRPRPRDVRVQPGGALHWARGALEHPRPRDRSRPARRGRPRTAGARCFDRLRRRAPRGVGAPPGPRRPGRVGRRRSPML